MSRFNVLEGNQKYLARLGLKTHHSEQNMAFLKSIFTYCNLFFAFGVFGMSNIMLARKSWPQLDAVLGAVSLIAPGLQLAGMFLSLGFNVKAIKAFYLELQKFVDEETEAFHIYDEVEQKCRKYASLAFNLLALNQIVHVGTLFYSFYNIAIGNFDITTWVLAFRVYIPFDTSEIVAWYLEWLLVFGTCVSYYLCQSTITAYFVCCSIYLMAICDHFDFVYNSVMDGSEQIQNEKNQQKYKEKRHQIWKRLCKSVSIHIKAFE